METILKSGYEKILNLFYLDKRAKIHLRDIARKTRLNENSATRFLKKLEKENILISEKDGNLKKYRIQKNTSLYLIFTLFDSMHYNLLPNKRKSAISYFFKELKDKPLIMVLFGSTAKGTFAQNSDIDILLIVNNKIHAGGAENYTESQTGIKINCLQVNIFDFINELKIKSDKVIQSALNSGYPIFNHLYFYEVFLNEN